MNEQTYSSIFKTEFQDLVDTKKALGFKYDAQALAFRRIDAFFAENNLAEKIVSKELCDKWTRKRSYESAANWSGRISAMRVFCRYLVDIGIPAYIPPKGIVRKSPRYNAHIYTDDELKSFFTAVDRSQSVPSECPYRSQVMPVFFRILYTSGMRVSELRLARIRDVDLEQGHIIVKDAKNHKDRIVPIHPALVAKCRVLKESIHTGSSEDEYFFMIRPGQAMPLVNVYRNFRRYLDQAGISHTGHGPRIHDFRWTYCVNLLRRWVDDGKDLMAYIPYMKTMLGHEGFEETAYYLKLTTEMYPSIRNGLQSSFPNLIQEVPYEEREFY
ncbi:Tyrosine recombinase XerC [Clostridioides difficile]|jgi:integrase/recombinase XerD|uniref:tyrosine-type recombinase/integrase n=1 Tax=Clostridioides difficile TaxID=1496 RepID=UPI00097FE80A|nr:tyrosine-type recombinase/integrase [Clostridioides difficile]SJQ68987.1 Tyrosine recombinase XerC [Clostridioides difficile]HBF2861212.1 tyrosine-type recombinase/integrase [Clostridioides difficile]HBF8613405.1 tyrosine-type recombinase/integrase [Clostridioides difficile]